MKLFKTGSVGSCVILWAFFAAQAEDLAQNVRVIWSGNAQTEAIVVWDSAHTNEAFSLVYDTVPATNRTTGYTFEVPVHRSGPYIPGLDPDSTEEFPSAPENPDFFYHHAAISNLTPGTVYYLAVKTGQEPGREYRFKTAPAEGQPCKLIYAGDSRTHLNVAQQISRNIQKMGVDDPSIVAVLHGGDYANRTLISEWKEWLDAYELTTTDDGKLMPIIPIIGNHDSTGKSPIFGQAYGNPGGESYYYVLRLNSTVRILCLNTEIDTEGPQKQFIRDALTLMELEGVTWRLAAFHKPVYPAIKGVTSAKKDWVPLFEDYQIDLVLESDGHCIKRTVPIYREAPNAKLGVVYLGEGGYGAPQREPRKDLWYLQGDQAFAMKGDHVMLLEFKPHKILYSTILTNGDVVDSARFKSRR
ncbi:MAG: metallophosphoesterase family protein [Kiritimatiellaceae bacterium]|nr:metallophosphoesterase family protein [Kiritimatiellaceae bacterium]